MRSHLTRAVPAGILLAVLASSAGSAARITPLAAHPGGAVADASSGHQRGEPTDSGAPSTATATTPAPGPPPSSLPTAVPAPPHPPGSPSTARPLPASTPTSRPAPAAAPPGWPGPPPGSPSGFVTVCGTQLCASGLHFAEKGATAYGQYANPGNEVALARQAGVTTLELVEFDTQYHVLSDTESSATWNRVDAFIAAAHAGGLRVILNLSEYGQSLQAAGRPPTTTDWGPHLGFIANRVNTVTHVRYANDPTIAMVELWGEIPAPGNASPVGTTQQLTDFFRRSLAEWKALAPGILVSSGGFSYLDEFNAGGIDWQTIMRDANNATCDVEINSVGDLGTTIPMVSSYCRSIGKPWFLAAWSSCLGAPRGSWDLDHWASDATMAAHAVVMTAVAAGAVGAAMAALGNDFWNLANGPARSGSCDIGAQFPLTLAAVG